METINTMKQKRFGKINTVNLVKSFDSFEDGYAEIIRLLPEIKVYCGETIMHNAVVGNILDTIKDNIPSTTNTNYPNTLSFSIDAHEVGLKTDAGMAFGWRISFDRDAGKTIYKFRITFITVPQYRKATLSAMKEAGWTTTTFNSQSRFWKSVEGRRKYSNNRRRFERRQPQEQQPDKQVEETASVDATVEATVTKEIPKQKETVQEEIPGSGLGTMADALKAAMEAKQSEEKSE